MGWGPSAPSPDPNIGLSQDKMADLATRQQDFYEKNLAPRALDQMDQQINISKQLADQQLGLSKKYDDRYWDTTAKYQDEFYKKVDQYSSADEQEKQAGMARGDVQQAMGQVQQQQNRGMSRMGVNPGSAGFAMANRKAGTEGALAMAGASTMARQAAKELGMRYTGAAAGMNEGLIGATQGASGGALAAGGAGMGAVGQMAGMSQGQLGAQGGAWGQIGNLGLGLYGQQMQGYGSQMEMYGALAGAGAGLAGRAFFPSDRRLKQNVVCLGTRPDGLKIYAYNYVWGGPRQVGVMADEVRDVYPQAVHNVHGYDMVDYSKLGG